MGYVETARGEDSHHDQEGRGKESIGQKKEKRKETEKIKTLNKNNLPLLSRYHLFHNSIQ